MIIKWVLVIALWVFIGFTVHNQFNPNTIFGSVMGSVFIFIWFGVLIFIKIELNHRRLIKFHQRMRQIFSGSRQIFIKRAALILIA